MKKRETRREIDLLSNIPRVSSGAVLPLLKSMEKYSVDYNGLMEEYEGGDRSTKYLFLLAGNNDPAVYQLIPLFCKHFGISVYIVEEFVRIKEKVPVFIRVKDGDAEEDALLERLKAYGCA
ncbi:uncharacterized protein NEMAJ01_1912 [Nematocida major]|uniref:uncharacterized protein n=1 Tax=Nematocida major TaxID=1912982 RepID=UPI002008A9D2|nr:uncharacterized protein NEMAJ01_1912 [Nematocida major]KAH9387016.1 hypothetical protein NEMAJ01_1912 [Nematocida major]